MTLDPPSVSDGDLIGDAIARHGATRVFLAALRALLRPTRPTRPGPVPDALRRDVGLPPPPPRLPSEAADLRGPGLHRPFDGPTLPR